LEQVWSVLDVDQDDAVNFREFRAFCEGAGSSSGGQGAGFKRHDVSSEAAEKLRAKFQRFVDKGVVRDFRELFDMADMNSDGTMSFSEFCEAVEDVARNDPSLKLRNRELEQVWSVLDVDEDDSVNFREFREFCQGGDQSEQNAKAQHKLLVCRDGCGCRAVLRSYGVISSHFAPGSCARENAPIP